MSLSSPLPWCGRWVVQWQMHGNSETQSPKPRVSPPRYVWYAPDIAQICLTCLTCTEDKIVNHRRAFSSFLRRWTSHTHTHTFFLCLRHHLTFWAILYLLNFEKCFILFHNTFVDFRVFRVFRVFSYETAGPWRVGWNSQKLGSASITNLRWRARPQIVDHVKLVPTHRYFSNQTFKIPSHQANKIKKHGRNGFTGRKRWSDLAWWKLKASVRQIWPNWRKHVASFDAWWRTYHQIIFDQQCKRCLEGALWSLGHSNPSQNSCTRTSSSAMWNWRGWSNFAQREDWLRYVEVVWNKAWKQPSMYYAN